MAEAGSARAEASVSRRRVDNHVVVFEQRSFGPFQIDDGDVVLMEPVNTAENGDMVAVWLKDEQEVSLKRIYLEPGRVCLKPANKLMEPIYQHPGNVEIQGRVVGVIRTL